MVETDEFLMGTFFGILGILFCVLTWLVLRKNRNQVNITFGFSTILFAISSFLCSLAYYGINLGFGFFGNLIMIIAPLGIFLAGKLILDGKYGWKTPLSLTLLGLYAIIIVVYSILFFIEDFQLSRSVFTGGVIISIPLILAAFVFYQIYQVSSDIPEMRTKISFLILGLAVGVFGIVSAVLSSNEPFVLPMQLASVSGLVINIGLGITALAFTSFPDRLRQSIKEAQVSPA